MNMTIGHGIQYTLIETQEHLERSMMKLTSAPWIAIDTEFIPENQYRPLLCIIQIASPGENFIIDCKYVHDLSPFLSILQNEKIVKITHAGKNDYEIIYEKYGILPKNVLDTQIANSFVEGVPGAGLGYLLSHMLDIEISKDEQNSDWWERPLTSDQINYALRDVIYLHQLIEAILKRLHEIQRVEWAIQESKRLEDQAYYAKDLTLPLLKNKWVRHLDIEDFALLLKIMEWRESKAKENNTSPEYLIKFCDIRDILKSFFECLDNQNMNGNTIPTKHRKHLARIHQLYTTITNEDLENAVKVKNMLPPNESQEPHFHWKYSLIKLIIKHYCNQIGFRFEMVCTSNELLHHLWNQTLDQSILNRGWRKDLLDGSMIKVLGESSDFKIMFEDDVISLTPTGNVLDHHHPPVESFQASDTSERDLSTSNPA